MELYASLFKSVTTSVLFFPVVEDTIESSLEGHENGGSRM